MCTDGTDRTGWLPSQFEDEDGQIVRRAAEDLARNARLARTFAYGLMAVGVIALVTLAGAALYQGAQVRSLVKGAVAEQKRVADDAERESVLIGQIMTCILGQFAEHREASRADHQDLTRYLGRPPLTHGNTPGPPQYDHDTVTRACEATTATLNSGQQNPLGPSRPQGGKPK